MNPTNSDILSSELLQVVLDKVDDLVVVIGRDGRRIYSNPSYDKVLGGQNRLPGDDPIQDVHPEDRDRLRQIVSETFQTGAERAADYRFLLADGKVRHIESHVRVIRNSAGAPDRVVIISRDVTEQRLAEEAIYLSQQYFRELFEHSSDVIIITDTTYSIIYGSPSVERVLGYRGEEYTGCNFISWLDPDEAPQVVHTLTKAREYPGIVHPIEHRMRHRLGVWRMFESMCKAVANERGIQTLVISSRDITERNRAEQFLQETNYTLQSLIRTSPLAIVATDLEFRVTMWNKAAEHMFGWTERDIIGDFLPRSLRDRRLISFGVDVPAPGIPSAAESEIQLQRRDGSFVEVSVWTSVLRNAEGTVIGSISICADLTERKQAKAALRDSERKFKELVELLPQCIFESDIDGHILFANQYALELFGCSRDESEEVPNAFLTIAADDRPKARHNFQRMVKGEPVGGIEYTFLKRDGTTFPGVMYASPIVHRGRHAGVRGVVVDVSEQKESEKLLREAESKFRHLVERSLVGVYIIQDGRFSYVNPRLAEIFGYSQEELLTGRTVLDLVTEADRQRVTETLRLHVQDGIQNLDYEFRGLRRDGSPIDLEVYGSRTEYSGRPAVIGTLLDITQRKRAETERARLSSAVEQAAEAIVITDPAGTILYVNPAFEHITGYTRDTVTGKNPRILQSGKQGSDFYEHMWSTLTHGEVWSGTITNKRKDNTLYEEEMVISPVRDEAGTVVNYVAVKRDVTHEREMERQLRQSQKMESLGQLAGGIAHDFNNVLSIIGGSLTLLKSKTPDEQLRRYIDLGEGAVTRGADIARRLLTFSRDEKVQLKSLSIADLVNELTKVLGSLIEKTVVLSTNIPPGLPLVKGDHGQLYQVLLNLCVNARDAILDPASGKTTGTITISAQAVEGCLLKERLDDVAGDRYVCLSVRDTGTGISEEVKQRMFDPFFTTKSHGKGTGLGLAVVYGIVRSHHGMIEVESQPGEGSAFHMYLPVCVHEPAAGGKCEERNSSGGTETILVVEDEASQRFLLTELLHMHGYTVISAADGMEALNTYKLRQDVIAAVITDMGLPRLSGEDLIMEIRAVNPTARVIMASGYLEPYQSSKLLLAGVRASINKPYHGADILKTLRQVLDDNREESSISYTTEESDRTTNVAP